MALRSPIFVGTRWVHVKGELVGNPRFVFAFVGIYLLGLGVSHRNADRSH